MEFLRRKSQMCDSGNGGEGSAPIELHVFGRFMLKVNGHEVAKLPKACQELLALLLMASKTGLHRDRAAQTLWPDAPSETARFYLRRTLVGCREALGSERDCLESLASDVIHLGPSRVTSDWQTFEHLLQSGAIDDLRAAFELAQNELLVGSKSSWVAEERMRILLRAQTACLKAAQLLRQKGDFSGALELLTRGHRQDPLDEAVILPYWECLVETGQETRFEESYRRTLERYAKADVEMTPRLAEAAKRLLRRLNQPDQPGGAEFEVVGAPWSTLFMTPLVGRTTEIRKVVELMKAERLVEISGPPGIGKTRLSLECARKLGWPAAYVSFSGEAIEVVHPKRRSLLIIDLPGRAPVGFAELIQGVLQKHPLLRVLVLSCVPKVSRASALVRLGSLSEDEANQLYRSIPSDRSASDGSTKDVGVAELDGNPAAVLAEAERVGGSYQRVMLRWHELLSPSEQFAVELLAGLNGSFTSTLASYLLADLPAPESILECLTSHGIVAVQANGRLKLSPLVKRSLAQSSAVGDFFLSGKEAIVLDDCPLLEPAIRECVETDPDRALSLLNLVGPCLAENGQYDRLAPLTRSVLRYHAEPSVGAVEALLNLGSVSHLVQNLAAAHEAFHFAYQAAVSLGAEDQRLHALLYLGEVLANSGELDQASSCLDEAVLVAKQLGDRSREARALGHLGYVKRMRREFDAAIELTTRALALQTLLGDTDGRVWCIGSLGGCCFEAGQYQEARTRFLEALQLHRDHGNLPGAAWNLTYLADASNRLGDYDSATDYAQQALAIQDELGIFHHRAWPLRVMSETAALRGEYEEAERLLLASLDAVRASGNTTSEAYCLLRLAEIATKRCDPAMGRAYLDLATEMGTRLGHAEVLHEVGVVAASLV